MNSPVMEKKKVSDYSSLWRMLFEKWKASRYQVKTKEATAKIITEKKDQLKRKFRRL